MTTRHKDRDVGEVRPGAAAQRAQARSDGGVLSLAAEHRSLPTADAALAVQRAAGNRAVAGILSPVQRVGTIITAPAKAGTSAHPTLSKGAANNKEAVQEAQEKLATSPGGPAALASTGVFDDPTEVAVKAFRVKNGLAESGVVDPATWAFLDAQGKSSTGRIERTWQETLSAGGSSDTYTMTSKYSYKVDATKIVVSVGINFVADATHPPPDLGKVTKKWTDRIYARWNQFKAEKSDGSASRDIVFQIVPTGGNTVTVTNENTGSDAGTWSVPDNENDNGPSHEFGHMIGLEDEYKRDMATYTKLHPGADATEIAKGKDKSYGAGQYSDPNSMMGMGALKKHDDKAADPEPRHVREFAGFVEKFLGGTWDAKKK